MTESWTYITLVMAFRGEWASSSITPLHACARDLAAHCTEAVSLHLPLRAVTQLRKRQPGSSCVPTWLPASATQSLVHGNQTFFAVVFCGVAAAVVWRSYNAQDLPCGRGALPRQLQINTIPAQQLARHWAITSTSGYKSSFWPLLSSARSLSSLEVWGGGFQPPEDSVWQGSCSTNSSIKFWL